MEGAWAAAALAHFTPAEIAAGHELARSRLLLFGARLLVTLAVLIVASRHGRALNAGCGRVARGRPVATAVLVALVLMLVQRALTLPLVYWSGFVLEHAHGLSNRTLASFFADYLKGQVLFGLVLIVAVAAWFGAIRRFGRWALPVLLAAAVAAMVGVTTIAPLLVDPLFHSFRPVASASVRDDARTLGARAGIEVDEVLEMDASRTTNRVNAYYTGLFGTRRVVLYDTLLGRPRDEVRLVLAHELGHWLHHHVAWGLALGAVGVAVAIGLLHAVLVALGRRGGWGFTRVGEPGSVAAALLVVFLLDLAALPIGNGVSRRFERQADRAALQLTGDREAFVAAEVELARRNVADVVPAGWVVWLLYTHPPVLERIHMAETEVLPGAR